jgi:hypothetical protein
MTHHAVPPLHCHCHWPWPWPWPRAGHTWLGATRGRGTVAGACRFAIAIVLRVADIAHEGGAHVATAPLAPAATVPHDVRPGQVWAKAVALGAWAQAVSAVSELMWAA